MGEVGGYDLHVYCDVPGCPPVWEGGVPQPGEFFGVNLRSARREARRSGWKMSRGEVIHGCEPAWRCPSCVKSGKLIPAETPVPEGGAET